MCMGDLCVADYTVFGIDNAEPFFYSSSHGLLGLGVSPGENEYSTKTLD